MGRKCDYIIDYVSYFSKSGTNGYNDLNKHILPIAKLNTVNARHRGKDWVCPSGIELPITFSEVFTVFTADHGYGTYREGEPKDAGVTKGDKSGFFFSIYGIV